MYTDAAGNRVHGLRVNGEWRDLGRLYRRIFLAILFMAAFQKRRDFRGGRAGLTTGVTNLLFWMRKAGR